jgi:Polyketide synthase modules and related proteins
VIYQKKLTSNICPFGKKQDSLKDYVKKMESFLSSHFDNHLKTLSLADVAYTLQVGREAMQERLAVIVDSSQKASTHSERLY